MNKQLSEVEQNLKSGRFQLIPVLVAQPLEFNTNPRHTSASIGQSSVGIIIFSYLLSLIWSILWL